MCFLLGGVAAGATVVVARGPADLAGCPVAFVAASHAQAALDAGVDEVLACSLTPFGTQATGLPPLALDAALEVPGYGDHFGGRPPAWEILLGGRPFVAPAFDLGPDDRLVTALDPATPEGLGALLGGLKVGAALILLADGDLGETLSKESATAWVDATGLHRCGG